MNKLVYIPLALLFALLLIGIVIFASGCGNSETEVPPATNPATPEPVTPPDPCAGVTCLEEGKECVSGACVCKSGLVATEDGTKCIVPEPVSNITEETETQTITLSSAWSDEYDLGETISEILTDSKIDKLIDKSIKFNDNDYDVSENVILNGKVETSLGNNDFDKEVYLIFNRNDIEYRYTFDDPIDIDDISSSEPLNINFLGQNVGITNVESDCFTLIEGQKYYMKVGDSVIVNEKTVKLLNVGTEGSIVVNVDGTIETIPKSTTETVNGIEIDNTETFYEDTKSERTATLGIGSDVSKEICSGDGYDNEDESDALWIYDIDVNTDLLNYISVKLNQNLNDIDNDFNALGESDSIKLGNYLEFVFKEISSEDYVEYEAEMSLNMVELSGDDSESFQCGNDEYRRIFMNSTNFLDNNLNVLACSNIELDNSGIFVTAGNILSIANFNATLDFANNKITALAYLGNDISDIDESLRTYDDVILEDVKDNFEDSRMKLVIPEEKAKVTMSIKG